MIHSIGPAIAAKPIIANVAPVLLQTVNVKFADVADRNPLATWNNVDNYTRGPNPFLDINNAVSTLYCSALGGNTWIWEQENGAPADADFPLSVLHNMVYTNHNEWKDVTFSGFVAANRRYVLTFGVYQSSGGNENITKITHAGTDYLMGGGQSVLGKATITLNNPATSSQTFRIQPIDLAQGYGCSNGVVIKIYQI